jgi:hypothetical protein
MLFQGSVQCLDIGWCSVVLAGVGWCWLVFVGVGWCSLVFVGVRWCSLVFVGVRWFPRIQPAYLDLLSGYGSLGRRAFDQLLWIGQHGLAIGQWSRSFPSYTSLA